MGYHLIGSLIREDQQSHFHVFFELHANVMIIKCGVIFSANSLSGKGHRLMNKILWHSLHKFPLIVAVTRIVHLMHAHNNISILISP
jgi:hypothetical protein